MSEIEKRPPIPENRRRKYEDPFNNSTSPEGVPPDVRAHIERLGSLHGQGTEVTGDLNKDYLGAFHAPYSHDLTNANLAIVDMPLEEATPISAFHKYGPSELRRLSKNGMGVMEPWGEDFDIPFDLCRVVDYGNTGTYGRFDRKDEVETTTKSSSSTASRRSAGAATML